VASARPLTDFERWGCVAEQHANVVPNAMHHILNHLMTNISIQAYGNNMWNSCALMRWRQEPFPPTSLSLSALMHSRSRLSHSCTDTESSQTADITSVRIYGLQRSFDQRKVVDIYGISDTTSFPNNFPGVASVHPETIIG
jgi:hypothetical protein